MARQACITAPRGHFVNTRFELGLNLWQNAHSLAALSQTWNTRASQLAQKILHAEVSASSIEARENHGAHAPLASAKIHGGYVQRDAVASGRSDSQLSDIAVSDAGSLVLAFESLCIVIKFMVGTNTGASTENL